MKSLAPRRSRLVIALLAGLHVVAALGLARAARAEEKPDATPEPAPASSAAAALPALPTPPESAPVRARAQAGAGGSPSTAAAAAPVGLTAQASIEQADEAPSAPPATPLLRLGAGVRTGYVGSSGFGAFASSSSISSFAVDATATIWSARRLPLTLAAGLAWDVGQRGGDLRGNVTSLTAHRFTVPIELRYRPWSSAYLFGRLAPGVALAQAHVEDASAPAALEDARWMFATDVSVGASILLAPRTRAQDARGFHAWLTPEVGYALTTSTDLNLRPARDASTAVGSDASTPVGALALSGFFWRIGVAVTY
jgi:hypothetical protein